RPSPTCTVPPVTRMERVCGGAGAGRWAATKVVAAMSSAVATRRRGSTVLMVLMVVFAAIAQVFTMPQVLVLAPGLAGGRPLGLRGDHGAHQAVALGGHPAALPGVALGV